MLRSRFMERVASVEEERPIWSMEDVRPGGTIGYPDGLVGEAELCI